MGIPFFAKWLSTKYSRIIRKLKRYEVKLQFQQRRAVSLSFDLNGVIHTEAAKVHLYGNDAPKDPKSLVKYNATPLDVLEIQHFEAITKAIYDIMDLVKPSSTLIIAVDGPAPSPKIYQQRQRRFKAKSTIIEERDQYQVHSTDYKTTSRFDSNCITPGTAFMVRLDAYIREWIELNRDLLPVRVIYSSHLVPGEGEHKIADYLRTMTFGQSTQDQDHILYGLDADLIMLGLLSPLKNFKLLRDDMFELGDIFHLLDITATRASILQEMNSIEDFVLLSFLIGNDFLTAFPSISVGNEGMSKLIEIYLRSETKLVNPETNRIDWSAFHVFMTMFATEEPFLLEAEAGRGSTYPSVALTASVKNRVINMDTFRTTFYNRAIGPKWKDPQINTDFPIDGREVQLNMATEWLGGIAWVFKYYREGIKGVNVEWVYHYNYSPLAQEVVEVLADTLALGQSPDWEWDAIDRRGRILFPYEQLVSVLPPASLALIPEGLRHLIASKDSPLADLYPIQFHSDLNSKQKEHEAVALLPNADAERIRIEVAKYQMTPEEALVNCRAEDLISKVYRIPR
jgi:5'-3' exoribonuclease 1